MELVSWDDEIPNIHIYIYLCIYIWKKMFQTTRTNIEYEPQRSRISCPNIERKHIYMCHYVQKYNHHSTKIIHAYIPQDLNGWPLTKANVPFKQPSNASQNALPFSEGYQIFHHIFSGWWYTYPSEKYEFVSWEYDIPNIWKNNPCMFHTTKQ